jgi:hypothetical protein
MMDVLCELRLSDGFVVQLVQHGPDVGDPTGRVELRYRAEGDESWDEGLGSLDWPPVSSIGVGRAAWAFDAEVVSHAGVLVFFGVAEPDAGCSVEFDHVTVALSGATLLVSTRSEAVVKFHGPLGAHTVRPRR